MNWSVVAVAAVVTVMLLILYFTIAFQNVGRMMIRLSRSLD